METKPDETPAVDVIPSPADPVVPGRVFSADTVPAQDNGASDRENLPPPEFGTERFISETLMGNNGADWIGFLFMIAFVLKTANAIHGVIHKRVRYVATEPLPDGKVPEPYETNYKNHAHNPAFILILRDLKPDTPEPQSVFLGEREWSICVPMTMLPYFEHLDNVKVSDEPYIHYSDKPYAVPLNKHFDVFMMFNDFLMPKKEEKPNG